jgi:protein-S-isoprenylcysteine O-methyltransferase Ste14
MSDIGTRPNRLPWPPLIYLAAVAASIVLWIVYPLPWIGEPLAGILFAVGCVLVVAVVALEYSAMRTLAAAKTTIRPDKTSEHLVTSGPYSFTRNPIYLGNTLLMIAIGLIAGIAWFLFLSLVAAFVTQKVSIEREEQHLEIRFGKKYRDYAKRVRRWA